MAAPKFSNPFAPLVLPQEAQQELRELADMFVARAIANYEQYLIADKRQLNVSAWKFLKQRDDVRVYCARPQPNAGMAASSMNSDSIHSVSEDEDEYVDSHDSITPTPGQNRSNLPVMLTVGTLSGDLYDTMYGVVNPTLDMMRIKTSYVDDGVVNAAVLATLQAPSLQDPFQSLSVKWAIKGQPLHIRTVVKNRDLVYLEATGLTRLPTTGEWVGYHLLHSVHFPETVVLPTSLRGNMSICAVYRQHDQTSVDVYARGFLDPTGRIMRALVIKSATDVMVSAGRNVLCAHMKKLAYALRRRHAPALETSTFDERLQLRFAHKSTTTTSSPTTKPSCCAVCSKGLSSLAVLTFGTKRTGTQCRLCLQHVCGKCSVVKRLASIAPQDGYLYQLNVPFCLLCVAAVTQANAYEIACDEVVQKDAPLGYGRSMTSSLSSTNMGESFDGAASHGSSMDSSRSVSMQP